MQNIIDTNSKILIKDLPPPINTNTTLSSTNVYGNKVTKKVSPRSKSPNKDTENIKFNC